MLRRLLVITLAVLAVVAASGCADDVSPAAVLNGHKISDDELLAEVAEWAGSPTLIDTLQLEPPTGEGKGSYPTTFVDLVLGIRIGFDLQTAKFEDLGLSLTQQQRSDVRNQLFQDPATTKAVFDELSADYGRRLIDDVARQFAVQDALGDGYQDWLASAYADAEVEVNPRYGTWDPKTGQVVPPTGPRQASTTTTLAPAGP